MAKTIVIFSTKGGVGKTFIASNLAVSLSREERQRVLLIDLDVQVVADMARMLTIKPAKSMVDLFDAMKKAPKIDKNDYVTMTNLGIDFLPVALNPRQIHRIELEKLREVFTLMDKDYDFIIVDAGKGFSETLVNLLNLANLILLVVTPDILSVYQTKWVLDTLQTLHFPLKMAKIVLNRDESISSITWQEVNLALPQEILARIPSEGKTVMQALNNGVPVVMNNPKARVSLAFKKLSQELTAQGFPFAEHKEIDELRLKEYSSTENGEFWKEVSAVQDPNAVAVAQEATDELLNCKRRIHQRLIDDLKLGKLDVKTFSDPKKMQELRDRAEKLVTNLLFEELGTFISSAEIRKKLIKEIMDEALGLGPLEDLLADPEVSDIMVNNKDEVYVERNGKIEATNKKFISNEQVKTIIERIIVPIGRRLDESVPMVDARLPDGSRVNAIIPPLSLTGPALTIRKFRKELFSIEELIEMGTLNEPIAQFLRACVLSRQNMIVSGGTGSGKTTTLNILSTFIPDNERIITIEDAAELRLNQEHWVRLEARASNIEGKGAITIRDLFRNTLRMRPDRIIIGECRGPETLDMFQAMNTGHDGSMTTIHANSTQDALIRLDSMVLLAGMEMPVRSIKEMISSAIDVLVHTSRMSDGSRKIVQITEVVGMKGEEEVEMKDIFVFEQTGVDNGKVIGHFKATGYVPSFIDKIRVKGISLPENIFKT